MIEDCKNITSEAPIEEVWKLLRFFRDVEFTSKRHCHILGISQETYKRYKSNIDKQAKQIGYCIRQAEEYFKASSKVGIATRPNLLYYGAVSLSRALILLKRTGDYSFDALRLNNKHNHHGLELAKFFKSNSFNAGVEDFFNLLQCSCYTKVEQGNYILWGNFPLFYQCLVPNAVKLNQKVFISNKSTYIQESSAFNVTDLLRIDVSNNNSFNSLDILKSLPDMYFQLKEIGISPNLCQGNLSSNVQVFYKNNEQGKEEFDRQEVNYIFTLDSITQAQKSYIIDFYKQQSNLINVVDDYGSNICLEISKTLYSLNDKTSTYIPDIVDSINHQLFYILYPENYLPEPAAYFVLLFCLGMLCRYYPDIWLKIIDENVQVTEVTDSLLNFIYRKFPNLILDQMTYTKHCIHLQ